MPEKIGNICYHCMQIREDENTVCPFCGFDITNPQIHLYNEENNALPAGSILENRYLVGCIILNDYFEFVYTGMDLYTEKKIFIHEFFPSELVTRNCKETFQVSAILQGDRKVFEKGKTLYSERFLLLNKKNIPGTEHVFSLVEAHETFYMIGEAYSFESLHDMLRSKPFNQYQEEYFSVLHTLKDTLHLGKNQFYEIVPERIFIGNSRVILLASGIEKFEFAKEFSSKLIIPDKKYCPPELESEQHFNSVLANIFCFSRLCYYIITSAVKVNTAAEDKQVSSVIKKKLKMAAKKYNIPSSLIIAIEKGMSEETTNRSCDFSGYMALDNYINIPSESFFEKTDSNNNEKEQKHHNSFRLRNIIGVLVILFVLLAAFCFLMENKKGTREMPTSSPKATEKVTPAVTPTESPVPTSSPIFTVQPTVTVSATVEPTKKVTKKPTVTRKPTPKPTKSSVPKKKPTPRPIPKVTTRPISPTGTSIAPKEPKKKPAPKSTKKIVEEQIEGIY